MAERVIDKELAARLAVSDIWKQFGPVTALAGVSFDVAPGEVHALLGQNGAGKSTLVATITGILKPDSGTFAIDGEAVQFNSVFDARRAGVVAVYQDPQLFPHLTVAENVFMGVFPRAFVDFGECSRRTRAIFDELGVSIDPRRPAEELAVAERQFVAIARALLWDVRLLLLDEPTAALTPHETHRLFEVVRRLRASGASIMLISHRLEDIRQLADKATVLRDGRRVLSESMSTLTDEKIVEAMLGSALLKEREAGSQATQTNAARELLQVESLSSGRSFTDISFTLHAGEIVVLAGLVGSGRTELLETLVGLRAEDNGTVCLDGRPMTHRTPRNMLSKGLALVPEDRDRQGLVLGFGVDENITLPILQRITQLGFLRRRREERIANKEVTDLRIKTASVNADVASLSGGNRQKVVLGKWLASNPQVLLLDEPTRGVDVGAKAEIHQILRNLAHSGLGILVASSDFEEVPDLADRVLVLKGGKMVGELVGADVNEESIAAAANLGRIK